MTNRHCQESGKIRCRIRCLDPVAVEQAMDQLPGARWVTVPYTCKLSGNREAICLLSDETAAVLARRIAAIATPASAKILAALASAELCECDVATLTGRTDDDVIADLERLLADGLIAHRMLAGMHYYRVPPGPLKQALAATLGELR